MLVQQCAATLQVEDGMDDEADFISTGNVQVAPDDGTEDCARFEVELDVLLRYDGVDRPRVAVNVSGGGIFAESVDHLPIGELVQMVAAIPGGAMTALATVERVVLSEEAAFVGGIPGLGLRFFLMDDALRGRWDEYLLGVSQKSEALPGDPSAAEHRRDKPLLLSRRAQKEPRRGLRLALRVKDRDQLLALYTRNVSKSGMFISTTRPLPSGSKLELAVIHPITEREYPLEGHVRWVCDEGAEAEQGMGLELVFPEGSEDAFLAFVNEG